MQFATTTTVHEKSSPHALPSPEVGRDPGQTPRGRNGSIPTDSAFAAEIKTAPWNKEERKTLTPGTRRLRYIGRDEQRPMECRLRSLRHVQQKTDAEASAILQQFNAGYGRKLSA